MTTLQRRKDGCFFIRHYYMDHNTWQILGEGVRYLERRGITDGGSFSTDIFMELYMKGLVYHGNTPTRPVTPLPDTVAIAAVRHRVSEFHRLICTSQIIRAWGFIWKSGSHRVSFGQFRINIKNLRSWKIVDIIVFNLPAEAQSAFDGANKYAAVTVRVSLDSGGPDPAASHEVTQSWLELNGQWRIMWSGFDI